MHVRYVEVFLAFTLLCLLNQSACLCIIHYFSYRIKNNFSLKLRSKHSYYFSKFFTKFIAHLFCTKIMQQSIQCSLFKTFLNSIFERKISFEIQKSVKYFLHNTNSLACKLPLCFFAYFIHFSSTFFVVIPGRLPDINCACCKLQNPNQMILLLFFFR